jgi:hypothetical protein
MKKIGAALAAVVGLLLGAPSVANAGRPAACDGLYIALFHTSGTPGNDAVSGQFDTRCIPSDVNERE